MEQVSFPRDFFDFTQKHRISACKARNKEKNIISGFVMDAQAFQFWASYVGLASIFVSRIVRATNAAMDPSIWIWGPPFSCFSAFICGISGPIQREEEAGRETPKFCREKWKTDTI